MNAISSRVAICAILLFAFNPVDAFSQTLVPTCGQPSVTLVATNPQGLSNPSYSVQPGGATGASPFFVVPSAAATFTLYTTGINAQQAMSTTSVVRTVTVTPAPLLSLNIEQADCASPLAVVSVTPGGSAANPFLLAWNPLPNSLSSQSVIGTYSPPLAPMAVSVTVTDAMGCQVSAGGTVFPPPPQPTFAIFSASGNYSITCSNPLLNLQALTSYTYGTISYSWASASSFTTGTAATLSVPGIYSVVATDPVTSCVVTKTISVVTNTVPPQSTLSPSFQNISCSSAAQSVTMFATPANLVQHQVLTPQGGTYTAFTNTAYYQPGSVGTFTYVARNVINGCSVAKTFPVTSSSGIPTSQIVSPSNFSLGCSSKSIAIISYSNASTTPPGGPLSYSLMSPSSGPLGGGPLSPVYIYTVTQPGTYTAVTRDNAYLCDQKVVFSVLSNTLAPALDTIMIPRQVLTCSAGSVVLTGYSSNTIMQWLLPGAAPVSGGSLQVNANSAAPTSTLVGNYTLSLQDNNNLCVSQTVVPIYQNLFPPVAAIAGNTAITCITPTILLSNMSTSGIPPVFPSPLPVISSIWEGPGPIVIQSSTTFTAGIAGVYTMTATDLNNGCTAKATRTIADQRSYPVITNAGVYCLIGSSIVLTANVLTPQPSFTYSWTIPATASATALQSGSIVTNAVGAYVVVVTNTLNGCSGSAVLYVSTCADVGIKDESITAPVVFPNPGNGLFRVIGVEKGTATVYDALSRFVSQNDLPAAIDLSTCSRGIYLCVIRSAGRTWTTRIVVE